MHEIQLVHVFTHDGSGGNPCPIVLNARDMRDEEMRDVALRFGHESGFVQPLTAPNSDYRFRFWVPRHEMEMCGHATIGAIWALVTSGLLHARQIRIATLSGMVTGFIDRDDPADPTIEITQPVGKVVDLTLAEEEEVLGSLRISRADLLDLPLQNAVTSRVKTLVPVRSVAALNRLRPDMALNERCCERIGSTGLYPYAVASLHNREFEARQFPKSSGYPEDAATGIAAAALAFGLLKNGLIDRSSDKITILQGRAMGSLSKIQVRLEFVEGEPVGCFLGGAVRLQSTHALHLQKLPTT